MVAHVERDEAHLLLQINRDIPSEIRHRYDELIHKRQAETLNDVEHTELIDLSQQFEQREAGRVKALANLARLRQISLPDLITALGIEVPTYHWRTSFDDA